MRFAALVAAIVRIVRSRDTERAKISSFLTHAQKKVWEAFLAFWDRIKAGLEFARPRKLHGLLIQRACRAIRMGEARYFAALEELIRQID